MLQLGDLFSIPNLEGLIQPLMDFTPGVLILSGVDAAPGGTYLPSGRRTVFRLLAEELLKSPHLKRCCIISADRALLRLPRRSSQRFSTLWVEPPWAYADRLREAIQVRPSLLLLDALTPETASFAFQAARQGSFVLAQWNSLLRGAQAVGQLAAWGLRSGDLEALRGLLAVHRLPALCPQCKQPLADGSFRAQGCPVCRNTGYQGDVALLDVYHAPAGAQLSMNDCARQLAAQGRISFEAAESLDQTLLQGICQILAARETALADALAAQERLTAELQAAQRVLQHRTQALFSLEELSRTLTTSDDLHKLGDKICQRARDVCGADRAVVYFQHTDDQVVVLAATGWDGQLFPLVMPPAQVFGAAQPLEPIPYNRCPPGLPPSLEEQKTIRAGLAIPLLAQDRLVGLMIVHSTHKPQFTQGEAALIQTFANQAAVALQRAGLVDQLRRKIDQLEQAHTELAKKERLEHELDLARQVQQSMLPQEFPRLPGCWFAAHNEPARQVGGDFYDVISLPEGRVGLAIGDVSDKGMPAALYMALTRSLLRAEARQTKSPREVLRRLNLLLLELGTPGMFVTLVYAVFDPLTRKLTYARAGHNRPMVMRGTSVIELGGRGMPLGVFEDSLLVLDEDAMILEPGDRLVLYTDGLIDALSPSEQMFGLDGLRVILAGMNDRPIGLLCPSVFTQLAAFRGSAEPFDDMALLVMEME
jgi:serine phosphatase RsbU (regulator of sigma subunit)